MVDVAIGSTSTCSENLAGVSRDLPAADRNDLRTIVESLVQTAKEMETMNHKLEERLTASKLEINQLAAASRGGAQRKSHRSADLAFQPQVL